MTNQRGGRLNLGELAVPFGLTAASYLMGNKLQKSNIDDSILESISTDNNLSETSDPNLLSINEYDNYQYRRNDMYGGSSLNVAILKTIDDLVVPIGLMSGAQWLNQRLKNKQRGGSASITKNVIDLSVPLGLTWVAHNLRNNKKERLFQMGGSSFQLPIIKDKYLGKWLVDNKIGTLTPKTLLPLGLVFILYMGYRRYVTDNNLDDARLSDKPNILDLAKKEDLIKYNLQRGVTDIDTDTPVPYALAMGDDVFSEFIKQH